MNKEIEIIKPEPNEPNEIENEPNEIEKDTPEQNAVNIDYSSANVEFRLHLLRECELAGYRAIWCDTKKSVHIKTPLVCREFVEAMNEAIADFQKAYTTAYDNATHKRNEKLPTATEAVKQICYAFTKKVKIIKPKKNPNAFYFGRSDKENGYTSLRGNL